VSDATERTRWWGWGAEEGRPRLGPAGAALVARELALDGGSDARAPAPPALGSVNLPESALPLEAARRLEARLGPGGVRTDRLARVARAAGKSYPDLVRLRSGEAPAAPDAVLVPTSPEGVASILEVCSELGVAVVPFGGGTSVVGGVTPRREGFAAAVSLDLGGLSGKVEVDRRSLTARVGPGTLGAVAEAELGAHGLTLGHFPQSYELATVGGFVATRSAGQASTGYGRIEDRVLGLTCATPSGELSVAPVPASAAGPSLRELVVGSEGILGVITGLTLAVEPAPEVRHYEGWSFRSFAEGVEALRVLTQAGAAPEVARLSDEEETRLSKGLAATGSSADLAGRAYLSLRGHAAGALAILGWEGESRVAARRRSRAARMLRAAGGLALGGGPGRSWARNRYAAPYLRDELMDMGALVDTLETATSWSGLLALHAGVSTAVRAALAGRGATPVVGCHVSHLYGSGASLYFTMLARAEPGREIEQWSAAKQAAGEAIVAHRATITHHHGVGCDHRRWMEAEVGPLGLEMLRSAKARLDPGGVMNPGKILPVSGEPGS
jgi:alkyldihydroxyacetonephosphate synthase